MKAMFYFSPPIIFLVILLVYITCLTFCHYTASILFCMHVFEFGKHVFLFQWVS